MTAWRIWVRKESIANHDAKTTCKTKTKSIHPWFLVCVSRKYPTGTAHSLKPGSILCNAIVLDARWCKMMQDDARWCKFTTFHNQKKASAACWALCGSRKVPGGQMNLAGDHLLAAPEVPTITIVEYMLNTCWIPDRSRSCEGPKESKQTCANGANACQTDAVVVPKSGHLRWTLARHVIQTGAWAVGNRERLSNMFKCPTWARHCKKASRESLPHI